MRLLQNSHSYTPTVTVLEGKSGYIVCRKLMYETAKVAL